MTKQTGVQRWWKTSTIHPVHRCFLIEMQLTMPWKDKTHLLTQQFIMQEFSWWFSHLHIILLIPIANDEVQTKCLLIRDRLGSWNSSKVECFTVGMKPIVWFLTLSCKLSVISSALLFGIPGNITKSSAFSEHCNQKTHGDSYWVYAILRYITITTKIKEKGKKERRWLD